MQYITGMIDPKKILQKRVDASSQAHVAHELGLPRSVVCRVLSGELRPTKKLLAALGIERVVTYRYK